VDHRQHAYTAPVRLAVATALGLTSIAASFLLATADGIGGDVRWAHHAGVSAAPLLLVAGAIAAVSVARPRTGRHGFMRLVAVLAFMAWGIAQLYPDSAAAGVLNDAAILLFTIDAACVVISDARKLRQLFAVVTPEFALFLAQRDLSEVPSEWCRSILVFIAN